MYNYSLEEELKRKKFVFETILEFTDKYIIQYGSKKWLLPSGIK